MDERTKAAITEYITAAQERLAALLAAIDGEPVDDAGDAAAELTGMMHEAYVWIDKARDRAEGNMD